MDGKDTNLRDGLAIARERRGLIAKWALVQWAVGLLIRVLQNAGDRGGVGQLVTALVSGLVGAAWAIASFFVVPVLALEGLGPKEALKRSIAVIRERWGEGIVGHATIGGAVFLVGVLPALVVGGLGYVSFASVPALGGALIAIAVVALIAVGVIGSALNAIFRVTLYRYATEGRGPRRSPTTTWPPPSAPRRPDSEVAQLAGLRRQLVPVIGMGDADQPKGSLAHAAAAQLGHPVLRHHLVDDVLECGHRRARVQLGHDPRNGVVRRWSSARR